MKTFTVAALILLCGFSEDDLYALNPTFNRKIVDFNPCRDALQHIGVEQDIHSYPLIEFAGAFNSLNRKVEKHLSDRFGRNWKRGRTYRGGFFRTSDLFDQDLTHPDQLRLYDWNFEEDGRPRAVREVISAGQLDRNFGAKLGALLLVEWLEEAEVEELRKEILEELIELGLRDKSQRVVLQEMLPDEMIRSLKSSEWEQIKNIPHIQEKIEAVEVKIEKFKEHWGNEFPRSSDENLSRSQRALFISKIMGMEMDELSELGDIFQAQVEPAAYLNRIWSTLFSEHILEAEHGSDRILWLAKQSDSFAEFLDPSKLREVEEWGGDSEFLPIDWRGNFTGNPKTPLELQKLAKEGGLIFIPFNFDFSRFKHSNEIENADGFLMIDPATQEVMYFLQVTPRN